MKKQRFIAIGIVLGLFITGFIIGLIIGHFSKKTFNVAFYGMDETLAMPVQEKIQEYYLQNNKSFKIHFDYLQEKDFKAKKIARKYDLFIGWQGSAFEELKEWVKPLPQGCSKNLISTVNIKTGLPLLLNHWELDYNSKIRAQMGGRMPEDLKSFEKYTVQLKDYVFVPFFAPAADDETLLAYISVYVEALYGKDFYESFLEDIKNSAGLNDFIKKGNENSRVMKGLLEALKMQVQNGLTLENWTSATFKDVAAFTEQNQIGVLFTSLLKHRSFDERLMDRYETNRMPVLNLSVSHGLIAPAVCAANLSKKEIAAGILEYLITDEVQAYLSDETKLAPVNAQCQPYDIQAYNVRYLAAVIPEGPLPDISNACFQTDGTKKAEFASEIRNYLISSTEK